MNALTQKIEEMADLAIAGCGQSHEVYVDKFCNLVDAHFSPADENYQEAIEIARQYDYTTAEERAQHHKEMSEAGYCCHGLDEMTCPCGCFED